MKNKSTSRFTPAALMAWLSSSMLGTWPGFGVRQDFRRRGRAIGGHKRKATNGGTAGAFGKSAYWRAHPSFGAMA